MRIITKRHDIQMLIGNPGGAMEIRSDIKVTY